jgi:hypothetical protein
MSLEKYKIITLGDPQIQFRIGRLTPAQGSFILGQVMAANLKRIAEMRALRPLSASSSEETPDEKPDAEGLVRATAMGAFLGGLDLDTHTRIQQMCLAVCAQMQFSSNGHEPVAMPIATADGGLLPQLAMDIPLVMRLEMEVLVFNLTDFFAQGGLSALTPSR